MSETRGRDATDARLMICLAGMVAAAPTSGTRQLCYSLVPGEAGWVLKLEQIAG